MENEENEDTKNGRVFVVALLAIIAFITGGVALIEAFGAAIGNALICFMSAVMAAAIGRKL